MIISLIVAMGQHRQIGRDNKLLWHIADDLKNFKNLTLGHHILMGRKTYESIGKPLPGRKTIVMSRSANPSIEGCDVVSSFEEATAIARTRGDKEFFICGGEEIYRNCLKETDRFYISLINFYGEADAFFPDFPLDSLRVIEERRYEKSPGAPEWVYRVLER